MTMSSITLTAGHRGAGLAAWLRSGLATLGAALRRERAFRATHAQLDAMSDRDLADIGITRFMITDVAREAAARA